jgi:para-aminobenzoate synthetase component 1
MQACRIIVADWREPLEVLAPFAHEPFAVALLSGGAAGDGWSYVARAPRKIVTTLDAAKAELARAHEAPAPGGPPFLGGLIGLATYEWGAALEPAMPQVRAEAWPDFTAGVYDRLLAFHRPSRRVLAIGRGETAAEASALAEAALADLAGACGSGADGPLAESFDETTSAAGYQAAVAAVIDAIAAGEIFQANIARRWRGRMAPGMTPFDAFARLRRTSPAPFAAYLRLPGLAVVSNSPERFLKVTAEGRAESRPIKGTRPRSRNEAEDAALAAELLASAKDRAENLMIVDLMRNDLSRDCRPGSVAVPELWKLESFSAVHHLVSTVTAELAPGRTALDLFASAFPAGSITGAPKLQAMQVIAGHEPPRGPYCGSLFWAGADGAFDSSVLIRTLAFEEKDGGWAFETRAGAGVTADSDPAAEADEAVAKIAAIRAALVGA